MHSDPLGRENYVRLICNGYLVMGRPIPPEFWDEWEALQPKLGEKSFEDKLLEITPEPMEVWAVMVGGGTFQLTAPNPAKNGYITLEAMSPMTGMVDYCRLIRADGTVLAQFPVQGVSALVKGDHLHVTLDAEAMVKLLLT
jgi:hypothetical protein